MSYTTISELPTEVQKSFDDVDQQVWMNAYNQAITDGQDQFHQKEQAWMQCKELNSSRYVCANVSTQVVDREGDLADVKQYVEAGQKLVEDGGILTKNHSNKIIGTVWKVEEGIDGKTRLPCVVAYMNYFRGSMLYDQSWEEFKKGRMEFSIGSYTKKPERECDLKGCHYRLIPEQWFELSNVDKGINPITYPVEVNDTAKGEGQGEAVPYEDDQIPVGTIVDMHDDICPAKAKYLRFKEQMKSWGHETHYDEEFLLIHGLLDEDEMAYIYQEYPDIREFEILKGDDGEEDLTLILPRPVEDMDDMLHDMVHLILDEQEAIQGYNTVMTSLIQGGKLSEEEVDKVNKVFTEIIHDEEKHIGGVLETIKILSPDMYSNIADGMKESHKEATKGECPAGQHEHAGVWGCHDIFRKHHSDDKTLPTDQLDLTDENIDVNAIQDTPTDKLKAIVRKVAKVLSRYGDKEVQTFLSSTPGKEFVLAFLELKRRKMNGENNMTEKEAGCSKAEELKAEEVEAPVEEAEKGTIPDIQSSIANISSTLASITAVIDQMNIRLMKLEDSDLMGQNEAQGTSITDAIMSEATAEDATEIPPATNIDEAGEDKGEVPPQFEKTDDDAEDSDEEEDKDEDEEKSETEVKVETKEEDESKDDDSKDDDESKDDKESEDKEESKEEDKKEESEEKKSDESKEEEKSEDKDEDKKEKEKGEAEDEQPTADTTPEDAPAPADVSTDAEQPVVEETKQDVPAVEEPEATVVEPSVPPTPVVEEMELPVPKGGQPVDFRAMLMSRQAELKAKGVELYIAEEGAQNSLANVPVEHIKGTNVSLVRPSNNISAFDAEMGLKSHSSKDTWKMMGSTTDSTNLLKKLIGE